MWKVDQILEGKRPTGKKGLTKKAKGALMGWALEAHKIDSSRPVGYYYDLFLDELRGRYSKDTKEDFFKNGIIEV